MADLERARQIFDRAQELPPGAREAYIARETEGDADLRRLVRSLLEEVETIDSGEIATAESASGARLRVRGAEMDGGHETIGRYEIIDRIGEGGFGIVYRARQSAPVRRDVALKVIKPGMDSASILRRFDAERQALALMDHPFVAKIFDGGATADGRPYFVMELVRGLPITDYCDSKRMPLEDRIRLFVQVCDAVQHAHAKGVLHRDLKPSNILISERDEVDGASEASPKVIDFGISKALSDPLTDVSVMTQQGMFVGTPEYMSPEQAGADSAGVDTRSDVYSLGVVLYELLTGSRPFDLRSDRIKGLFDMQRVIREEAPTRPSTRVLEGGDGRDPAEAAERMRIEPRALAATLRRDLDWVVMTCLEKERERRYETVNALAADLGRFLKDEPLLAGPPSARYRVGKFVKRNRALVVSSALVAATLVLGLAGTTWGLISTQAARDAERAQFEETERQRERAEAQLTYFSSDVIGAASPSRLGANVSVLEAVDDATARLEETLADEPELRAWIERDAGRMMLSISQIDRALRWLGDAEERFASLGEEGRLEQALTQLDLAIVAIRQEAGGESVAQASSGLSELRRRLAPDDERVLNARRIYADALRWDGQWEESAAEFAATLAAQRRVLGAEAPAVATTLYDFGLLRADMGDHAEAERLLRESLRIREAAGPDSAEDALESRAELGLLLLRQGRTAEARDVFDALIPEMEAVYGPRHWRTIKAQVNRNIARISLGETAPAADEFPLLIDAFREVSPASGRRVVYATIWAASALSAEGEDVEAIRLLRRALGDLDADPEASSALRLQVLRRLISTVEAAGGSDDLEAMRARAAALENESASEGDGQGS